MSDKIIVPTLGESVTEATVSKWLKSQGEKVSADEPVVELETDKVNVEVPAPSNGVLEQIAVNEGETVNVGALLGMINGSAKEAKEKVSEIKSYSPPKKETRVIKEKVVTKPNQAKPKPIKNGKKDTSPLILEEDTLILDNAVETNKTKLEKVKDPDVIFSPAARKMVAETRLDPKKFKELANME